MKLPILLGLTGIFALINSTLIPGQEIDLNPAKWEVVDFVQIAKDSFLFGEQDIFIDENWEQISAVEYAKRYRPFLFKSELLQQGELRAIKLTNIDDEARSRFYIQRLPLFHQIFELEERQAPRFTLESLSGNVFDKLEMKGKVVVLSFWFINCPPCIREIPELNLLVEEFAGNENVVFLAYALDGKDDLKGFLKDKPFHFEIIPRQDDLTDRYPVRGYPTNIVIGPKGRVELILNGSQYPGVTQQVLRRKIKELQL